MVHRTKLYQNAGSPLIQGRSRIERPVWQGMVIGAVVSFIGWAAALVGDVVGSLGIFTGEEMASVTDLLPGPAVALAGAALAGGWLGAGLASKMGWHRGWKTAAIVAALADLIAVLIVF